MGLFDYVWFCIRMLFVVVIKEYFDAFGNGTQDKAIVTKEDGLIKRKYVKFSTEKFLLSFCLYLN